MNTKKVFSIALLTVTVGSVLSGCSSESAATTPEEKKTFMGSAPPADFQKQLAAGQAAAQQKSADAAKNQGK